MVKKKSFSGDLTGAMNPVLQIIDTTKTAEEAPRADAPKAEAPEGYYMDPRFIEKKTRRVGLLMRPSLYARLKEYADDIASMGPRLFRRGNAAFARPLPAAF